MVAGLKKYVINLLIELKSRKNLNSIAAQEKNYFMKTQIEENAYVRSYMQKKCYL